MALPYIKIEYTSDIGTQYYVRLLNFLAFLEKRIVPTIYHNNSNKGVPSVKFDLDIDQNLIYVEPTQISIDPTICFVNKSVILGDNTFTYTDSEKLSDNTPFISNINDVGYGRIMNIYVNSAFIVNILKLNADRVTGDLGLYDFLKKILNGITFALGGLNNLDLFIDETTNEIKIIDKNPLPNKNELLKYFGAESPAAAVFSLYGFTDQSSFVREFSFKSELTKEYAAQVTTAAQQNGIVVGEKSMPLASLNAGTTDRYKFKIINDTKLEEELKNPDSSTFKVLNESWVKYKEFLARLENLSVTKSDISMFKTKLKDLININLAINSKIQKKKESESVVDTKTGTVNSTISGKIEELSNRSRAYTFSGFVPLNLQLTIDGLSGMKIGQVYKVDDNFLPSSYPKVLEFLIKNIKHQISDQRWTTQLESFAISQTQKYKYLNLPLSQSNTNP